MADRPTRRTSDLKDVDASARVGSSFWRWDPDLEKVVGDEGPASGDATFTHIQDAAAAVWTIDHALPKRPSVAVTDTAGTLVQGRVEYVSDTRVVLRFSAPFSGRADLN